MQDCFSETYSEARGKFRAAAKACNARTWNEVSAERGPSGETLTMDFAYRGSDRPDKLLVLVSGTHGPEGYAGSAVQVFMLRHASDWLPVSKTGVLLVHAHNPFGFAWGVRVTEEGVDLNRNYLDHAVPPENPVYDRFAEHLGDWPEQWSEDFLDHYYEARSRTREEFSETTEREAFGAGQYKHEHGFFFGGFEPTWSNRTLSATLSDWAGKCGQIVAIDIHTGLGPTGSGELLSLSPQDSDRFRRSRSIFGEIVQSMPDGHSVAAYSTGNFSGGLTDMLTDRVLAAHALEFGTRADKEDEATKVRCQWLIACGDMQSDQGIAIREAYRSIFYPAGESWRKKVMSCALNVVAQARSALNSYSPVDQSRSGSS